MATLFKKSLTRWQMPDGARAKPDDPGAGKVAETSAKWYGRFRDHDGILRTVALAKDKRASERMLEDRVRKAERVAAGLESADPQGHADKNIAQHLEDLERGLLAEGVTAKQARQVTTRAAAVFAGCGFRLLRDIRPAAVVEFIPTLRTAKRAGKDAEGNPLSQSIGPQTKNFYLAACKQVCRWCVKDGRLAVNPLEHLDGWTVAVDVRHARRALTTDEARKLLDATAGQPERLGLSGTDRSTLYAVALGTGLRAAELASLTPASFNVETETPTVTILAQDAKNRAEATLPLHPGLAELLRAWLAGKAAESPLWPGNWADHCHAGKILQRDLKAAGVPYRTAEGVADFHALRHTYGTIMGKAGVELSARQALMRHSDPKLTNRYTHLGLVDLAGSVPALPAQATTPVPVVALRVALAVRASVDSPGTPWQMEAVRTANDRKRFCKGKDYSIASHGGQSQALDQTHPAGVEPATFGSVDRRSIH